MARNLAVIPHRAELIEMPKPRPVDTVPTFLVAVVALGSLLFWIGIAWLIWRICQ